MQYSFLKESVGRDLVGASKFMSRKKVAKQILLKYPQPQLLADQLQNMANNTFGKEKEKLIQLSLQCRGCDQNSYPKFINSIAGFSSIWKYIGVAAGTTAVAAATNYVLNDLQNQASDNPNYTIKDGLQKTATHAMTDTNKFVQKIPGLKNTTIFKNPAQTAQNLRSNIGKAINYYPNKWNKQFAANTNANYNYLKNMARETIDPFNVYSKFY